MNQCILNILLKDWMKNCLYKGIFFVKMYQYKERKDANQENIHLYD